MYVMFCAHPYPPSWLTGHAYVPLWAKVLSESLLSRCDEVFLSTVACSVVQIQRIGITLNARHDIYHLRHTHTHTIIQHSSVARICCEEGQRWKLCHGTLMADFMAGCSSCSCSMTNRAVPNSVLIEIAASCWHLHQLYSRTLHKKSKKGGKDEEVNGQGGRGVPRPHTGGAYDEQHIVGIKWVMNLKPNNLLVSNDVNGTCVVNEHI